MENAQQILQTCYDSVTDEEYNDLTIEVTELHLSRLARGDFNGKA